MDNPYLPPQQPVSDEESILPISETAPAKRKTPIIFAALIAILAISIGSYFIYSQTDKNNTSDQKNQDTLANASPGDFDTMIKSHYATAKQKAVEANANYQLSAIEIILTPDLDKKSGLSRYVFTSADDTNNNWTIAISHENNEFIRAVIPKNDYFGEVLTLNTALWKFNHVTALQIAEKNGGEAFRKNNQLTAAKATLRHLISNDVLVWTIEYKGPDSLFRIKIDASSGNIIEN